MNNLNDWIKQHTRARSRGGRFPWWAWGLVAAGGLSMLVGWLLRKRVLEPKSQPVEEVPFHMTRVTNMTVENIAPVVQEILIPTVKGLQPEQPARADDLTIIEGIGSKIAGILNNAGIRSFAVLASTSIEELEHILRDAGIRMNNPASWPEQASLAAAGDWEGLQKLQAQLKGGRIL